MRINGVGAGLVAEEARRLGAPVIQLSTDYVFDGSLDRPYREDDPTAPLGAYGRSKLEGEEAVAAANPRSVMLLTACVRRQFRENHAAAGRDSRRTALRRRPAPMPDQCARHRRRHFRRGSRMQAQRGPENYGVFHLTGAGEATSAAFAEEIFSDARAYGRKPVKVTPIATADYPTPARRPANSRLDGALLERVYGVRPPPWRDSLRPVVARLLEV